MVSSFARGNIRPRDYLLHSAMDATAVFHNLLDYNASKRVEVLMVIRKLIRNSNSHLPFRNMSRTSVFEVLSHVLDDVRWEVRYQCLLLIAAIIQNSEDEIDSCMVHVLPRVIANLGHENANIRRSALQVLHQHMKYTNNLQRFLKVFVDHGLESAEFVTRKGCIISVGILFTSEFASENLSPLVESLAKQFVRGDASLFYPIFLALQKISQLVGPATFDSYLQRSDEEAVSTYKRVLNKFYFSDSCLSSSSGSHSSFSGNINEPSYSYDKVSKFDFGIFEPHILDDIKSEDWKVRIEGVEHMKTVLKDTPDLCDQISDMDKFLVFLSALLGDSNFKIVSLTLSIYDLLIDKFRKEIRRFLKTFVSAVARHLGDSKLVIREHAVKIIHKLMHHVKPSDVLSNLFEFKSHRNPKLREEVINRVTGAVLTFPSYSIEFPVLCEAVAPLLVDTKRRVRLAALECFAVLAQAMGPSRLIPLVAAVDAIELHFDGEGLMAAVQARLARRILPKCTEDGVITYAITIPSSAGNQNRSVLSYGADIDWIMAASGSSSSSTPPSRSKESVRAESSVFYSRAKILKSKSDDLMHAMKAEEEEEEEEEESFSDEDCNIKVVYRNSVGSGNHRRKSSCDSQVAAVSKPIKGTSNYVQNLLPSRVRLYNDHPKTRPIIAGSRIPVLARNTSYKSSTDDESPSFAETSRRRMTMSSPLPDPSSGHNMNLTLKRSATERNCSHEGRSNSEDSILPRKVSPCTSATGSKTILVRSPSVNHIEHLPHWDTHAVATAPPTQPASNDKAVLHAKPMGNVGSYFRTSPDGVIIAQPVPVHLDNVNDINVIVLDDPVKMPSSPSPKSWPSAELFHLGSSDSYKTTGRHSPVTRMPDVYTVRRNSNFSAPAIISKSASASPLNGVDASNIMSKAAREKMLRKKQEIMKETEERRMARERNQQEHKQLLERRLLEEKERQMRHHCSDESTESERTDDPSDRSECATPSAKEDQRPSVESLSKPSTPVTKPQSPHAPRTPPQKLSQKRTEMSAKKSDSAKTLNRSSSLKTTSASKRIIQLAQPTMRNLGHMSKSNLAASSLNLFDDAQNAGLSPYPNPDEALKKALKSLSTETWMGKIEGIQTISRLAQLHPEVLLTQLHAVVLGLLAEVKNLRSSVSRSAIMAVGELFSSLKRNMEQDLDLVTSTLLSKSGETVAFIRDDIDKVMKLLLESVTPNKAALAIIAGGASHRNGAVRKTAAHSLLGVVEKMGPARVIAAKDVSEKLFPMIAQFLMDGTPLTRYYARRMCELLMSHPSFDKLLLKYVQPNTLRNINTILDTVRKKGAGDMPREKMSARTHKPTIRRSGLLNRTM